MPFEFREWSLGLRAPLVQSRQGQEFLTALELSCRQKEYGLKMRPFIEVRRKVQRVGPSIVEGDELRTEVASFTFRTAMERVEARDQRLEPDRHSQRRVDRQRSVRLSNMDTV
jgi:hypothetical protein